MRADSSHAWHFVGAIASGAEATGVADTLCDVDRISRNLTAHRLPPSARKTNHAALLRR